ncbi:MAG TPA: choice-of-anchor D domain-containing protein [Conexibacter sp.]|jgi:alpha-tubulin suppressor-like RCC1 family protein
MNRKHTLSAAGTFATSGQRRWVSSGMPIRLSLRVILPASVLVVAALAFASSASASTISVGTDDNDPQTCAIQANGTVSCWGDDGSIPTPTMVPGLSDAVDISGHGTSTCAVRAPGSVVCWTAGGTPSVPTGSPSDAVAIGTGTLSSCAIRAGGTVSCWGNTGNDQLGGADHDGNHVTDAIAVTSGDSNSCVIARGGKVSCWGKQYAAVPSDLTDAVSVSSGGENICAVRSTGHVTCWGRGFSGEFGQPYDSSVKQVTIPGIADATRVAVADRHVCVLRSGGGATCWGDGTSGQLGQGTLVDSTPVAVSGLNGATDIAAGSTASCARLGDGSLQCWGDNKQGLMGTGTSSGSATPVTVSGITDATAVSGRGATRCAVRSGGGVSCWGDNDLGELGDGSAVSQRPFPGPVTGISTATGVAVGWLHACALLTDNSVKCWGLGIYGQIGNGATDGSLTPTTVTSVSATKVATMDNTACAILVSGSISCWGESFGSTAAGVTGTANATDVVGGSQHMCAIEGAGTVVCWGANYWGFLGNGSTTDSPTTAVSTGITDATALQASVGGNRTCAKRAGGDVWCWGLNPDPAIPDPNNQELVPTNTGSTSFPVDTTSDGCTASSGHVTCIGDGSMGQLGDGYQPAGHYPVQAVPGSVPALTGVLSSPGTTLLPDDVSVSPTSLAFPTTSVGPTSLPQTVTATNTAGRWLSLYASAPAPSPASEFGVGTTCGATLAPGASCTTSYVFHPTSAGDKTGSATIELAGRAHTIALSGAVSTGFLVTPGSLTFPATTIGTTSAGQSVVVVNVSGQTKALDTTITGLGTDFRSSTACDATLAPGGTCTVTFSFAPTAAGTRSANAVVTLGGVPNAVALSGDGVPKAVARAVPSNAFAIKSAKVSKKTQITLTLSLPGRGKAKVTTTIKQGKKRVAYAETKTVTAKKAGTAKATLTPGKKAKAALKKLKKAKVSISVSFTPTGGVAAKKTKSVTVTGSKKRSPREPQPADVRPHGRR